MGKDLNGKDIGKGFSQRKDGRYEARAVVNGVKIGLYNMSLAQLKKDFAAEKAKVLREEKGVRPANTTLNDWYKEWFETCKAPQLKNDVSRKVYERKIRNTFIRILGYKRISDITQMNVQAAANELAEEGYTDRSIREGLGVLRECMDIAVVNKLVANNPVISINVKNSNNHQKERRVLSNKEQEIFMNEVKGSYYYELYCILLLTGMRIGEVGGLQWHDIDWTNKCINVNRSMSASYQDGKKIIELTTPKTSNSYRKIPFFGETEDLLKSWKTKQNTYKKQLGNRWRAESELGDLVFTTTMGSPVTRYVLSHDINKVVKNLNLKELTTAYREGREPELMENIHPHAFRHTFATRCFEKKIDPLVIQKIMGHSNYSTTLTYTHVLNDKLNEEVEKIGDFFA